MQCTKCNAELGEGVLVCPNCGMEMVQATVQEKAGESKPATKAKLPGLRSFWTPLTIGLVAAAMLSFARNDLDAVFVLGCLTVIASIIALVVNAIRRRRLKFWGILMGVGLVILIVSIIAPDINIASGKSGAILALIIFVCLGLGSIAGALWLMRIIGKPEGAATTQEIKDCQRRRAIIKWILGGFLFVDALIIFAILATQGMIPGNQDWEIGIAAGSLLLTMIAIGVILLIFFAGNRDYWGFTLFGIILIVGGTIPLIGITWWAWLLIDAVIIGISVIVFRLRRKSKRSSALPST
jgi:hypothetical protein